MSNGEHEPLSERGLENARYILAQGWDLTNEAGKRLLEAADRLKVGRDAARYEAERATALLEEQAGAFEGFEPPAEDGCILAKFKGSWATRLVASAFFDFVNDIGAKNYVETTHARDGKTIVVTVRRLEGKTPDALRREAEAERDAARAVLHDIGNIVGRDEVARGEDPDRGVLYAARCVVSLLREELAAAKKAEAERDAARAEVERLNVDVVSLRHSLAETRAPQVGEPCLGCGAPMRAENVWMEDGCPCNTPRGVNDRLRPRLDALAAAARRLLAATYDSNEFYAAEKALSALVNADG